jgi:hypothetical protein
MNDEWHRPKKDSLAVRDRDALPDDKTLPTYVRAVRASSVLQKELIAVFDNLSVPRAHLGMIDDDAIVRRSSNRNFVRLKRVEVKFSDDRPMLARYGSLLSIAIAL